MHYIHQAHTVAIPANIPQQSRENPSVIKAKEAIARAMESHPQEADAIIDVDDTMATSVPHLWAIGDATGKMMLAHAASAQGIVAVENICGRAATVDYQSIPAAAFTHPEVSFVGLTEPQAKEKGVAEGFKVATAKSYFKGNSKAIAEGETEGLAKIVYREDTGELLGVHIIGIHASDLIHEASAAIRDRQTVQKLATIVHAHPTLSEVLDEAYKRAAHI